MRDADVRRVVRRKLATQHQDELEDTLFVEELGLCNAVRVDVAVVNGDFSGYELKSARDTLTRLPAQVAVYSKVLDYATLVVAENHLKNARRIVRPWWGVEVVRVRQGVVVLEEARIAKPNPGVDKSSLVQLLWKAEALAVLERLELDRGVRSRPRDAVWSRLADSLELDELRFEVRSALKARRGWRDGPERAGRGETLPREGTLSRFLARRIR
ncbi:sce7726 family protein [Nocardioides lacus]|uniref:sce7726 family protein n=1 Tax=Nocardioides sp. BP30 TaxID=3036374 RepID=UPI00406CC1BC